MVPYTGVWGGVGTVVGESGVDPSRSVKEDVEDLLRSTNLGL